MPGDPTKQPPQAPAGLVLIRDFVNTFDAELGTEFEGEEHLPDPAALEAWLGRRNLHAGRPLTQDDLNAAVRFREALRRLLLANNGAPLDRAATRHLAKAADGVALGVRVGGDGAVSLEPVGDGVGPLLARLLAAVASAQQDGSWSRLKACQASDCHWAFFDQSRNRSRTWCAMEVCGNRAKTRSYRARRSKSKKR